jgi:fucose 4-O-acetylase-like acetyltransferase
MPERLRFIDVAKGMSIVLVAFGHSHLVAMNGAAAGFNRSVALFRMPFFFFLSGLFFDVAKPFGTLVREKSDALLKPYVVTLGIVVLARALVADAALPGELARVLYGVGTAIDMPWAPLWYLTHLWVLFLYARGLVELATAIDLPVGPRMGMLALQTIGGLSCLHLFRDVPIALAGMRAPLDGLPFSIDLLCVSSTYLLLGYALRERVLRFQPNVRLAAALLLVFVALNVLFHPRMDLNQRIAVDPLATTACSLAGIYLALSAAYAVNASETLGRICAFFGFNSIFVLLFHAYLDERCRRLVSYVMAWQPGHGTAATSFVVSVVCAAALGAVIRRTPYLAALYLPRKAVRRALGGRARDRMVRALPAS